MHLFVYLHGFRSSPFSTKSQLTKQAIDTLIDQGHELSWYGPQLPPSPLDAMLQIMTYINQQSYSQLSVIGSSLGGYYATYLAEKYGESCRATLLNPAIEPARDLEKYIGEQNAWHSEDVFYFKSEYICELQDLYIDQISFPERYQLLAAKDDEVLDWQEMVGKYLGVNRYILNDVGHALSNYSEYLSRVLKFHLD